MTYRYLAIVDRWVDGDTVDLIVDVGFYITITARFRLYGIDTPERGHPLYGEATARANDIAPHGSVVHLQSLKAADKYGRWLGTLTNEAGVEVNATLIAEGLARPYFGGTKEP